MTNKKYFRIILAVIMCIAIIAAPMAGAYAGMNMFGVQAETNMIKDQNQNKNPGPACEGECEFYQIIGQGPPTCTKGVTVPKICKVCGYDASYYIPALEHDWRPAGEKPLSWPTCDTDGEEKHICYLCEETKFTPIPALGHNWMQLIEEPLLWETCDTDGKQSVKCRVCDKTDIWPIPAKGHKWGSWIRLTAPTCITAGEEYRICANDSAHKALRPVAPLGHDLVVKRTLQATETTEGYIDRECTRCDHNTREIIPVLKPEAGPDDETDEADDPDVVISDDTVVPIMIELPASEEICLSQKLIDQLRSAGILVIRIGDTEIPLIAAKGMLIWLITNLTQ